MSKRSFGSCLLLAVMLLFLSSALATAGLFTSIVVYGDSLSDNGNLYAASGNTIPGAPYFQGRRSDGPLAVEQLATSLGTPLTDFAWIGATTGVGNYGDGGTPTSVGALSLPGMQSEFGASAPSLGPFLAGGLFIVWGGANDFLSPSPLDTTPLDVISRGVGNIVGIVTALQGLGAQNILVPGLPDMGLTPYYQSLGPAAAAGASAITDAFNATLLATLPPGVKYYDTASLVRDMVANPAAYGFTNVNAPCFDGLATVCANPGQYLFYDDFHPTTATDSFLARGFEDTVTPEPGTISLLAGLALFAALRRRAARR